MDTQKERKEKKKRSPCVVPPTRSFSSRIKQTLESSANTTIAWMAKKPQRLGSAAPDISCSRSLIVNLKHRLDKKSNVLYRLMVFLIVLKRWGEKKIITVYSVYSFQKNEPLSVFAIPFTRHGEERSM